MNFNLDGTQGEWFQFISSHIDLNTGDVIFDEVATDARVQVRSLVPFIEDRLSKRKKTIEHIYNPKTRAMERLSFYEDFNFDQAKAERDDSWDYIITGLENFKDAKTGQEISCTRENKIKLMQNPLFDRFIARCLQIIASSGAKAKEESEKNL